MRLGIGMGWLRRHRWPVLAGVALAIGAVVVVVAVWPEPEPQTRARTFRDYDICVLTNDKGLADPGAAAVWAGAQRVSDAGPDGGRGQAEPPAERRRGARPELEDQPGHLSPGVLGRAGATADGHASRPASRYRRLSPARVFHNTSVP